ncbi:hypothetical protein ACQPZF_31545 [Actinosynnema sp. CS-041913]|uniref:hypothetical protein n=1 Tax=Actinosynnema sp. CS-041913 TaxID=3239917 RepID=UPI003D8D0E8E
MGEMAGVDFGPSDIVQHHVNVFGEDLIFWQRRGEGFATLLHSDLDWHPEHIGPEHFHPNGRPGMLPGIPVVAETILSTAEAQWLAACFDAAQWARKPAVDDPPLHTNIDARDNYVAKRVERRLRIDPDALTRSIQELRAETAIDHELATIAAELESDAEAGAEALSTPWREMSDKARRLVTFYLVEEVHVGPPALPIDEQFRIVWRCPRPAAEYDFGARVGQPSTRMSSNREIVSAFQLRPGDRIYWLSRHGNERGRDVSAVWDSEDTPGAVCVLFDQLSLGDTFWPEELFVRKASTGPRLGAFPG